MVNVFVYIFFLLHAAAYVMKAQTPSPFRQASAPSSVQQPVRVTVTRPRTVHDHFTSIILRMKLFCSAAMR